MARQVILHLGFHKTATTSLQATLTANKELLQQQGILFPAIGLPGRPKRNHGFTLFSLFTDDPGGFHMNIRWKVNINEAHSIYQRQFIESLESDAPSVLISGENLSTLPASGLAKLRAMIESYGRGVKPLVLVRSPTDLLPSILQEKIKAGGTIPGTYRPIEVRSKIETIRSVFPETEFLPFAEARKFNGGPVLYQLEAMGIGDPENIRVLDRNASLSDQATRLIAYLNSQAPTAPDEKLKHIASSYNTDALRDLAGEKFELRQDEVDHYLPDLMTANQYLLDMLGPDYCDTWYVSGETLIAAEACEWRESQVEQLQKLCSNVPRKLWPLIFSHLERETTLGPDVVARFNPSVTRYALASLKDKLRRSVQRLAR